MRRLAAGLLLASAGCSGEPAQTAPAPVRVETAMKEPVQPPPGGQTTRTGTPVSGLPDSEGKAFYTLDEYLAHLRKLGAYDVAYYVEVQPGVYEAVTGPRPAGPPPVRYTRGELERRFGFRSD